MEALHPKEYPVWRAYIWNATIWLPALHYKAQTQDERQKSSPDRYKPTRDTNLGQETGNHTGPEMDRNSGHEASRKRGPDINVVSVIKV